MLSLLPTPSSAVYVPGWIEPIRAERWLAEWMDALPWSQPEIQIFGRRVPVPRREVWVGDAGASYRYSGVDHQPHPWSDSLARIRAEVEQFCEHRFNSVLVNLYRDGRDSNGWHSDDEPELGPEPVIASVSLGATRRFLLRSRSEPGRKVELALEHGSLLVMSGRCQADWQHTIPKQLRVQSPRINLTFRFCRPATREKARASSQK